MTASRPRYALYTRISKDPTGDSTAPARQEKECRALARERGIRIVDVYTDTDLSAYREDVIRPQYEALLSAMADGRYDGVIVWKLDRLVRRIVEFSRFWKVAEEHQVALLSRNDSIDTSNPIGLAIVYLIVGLAQQESYNTSLRLKAKERELAEAGIHKGAGRRAYGLEPGWRETVPDEVAVIRDCAERLLVGETITGIVRDLNRRNVPSATGKRWTRQSLYSLMRQARLFGWREHEGELVAPGDWPAILDEATGRRLREILSRPGTKRSGARRTTLLSGMLRCEKCKSRMKSAGGGNRRRVYVCPAKTDGGCAGTSIVAAECDDAVTAMALHRLDGPGLAEAMQARRSTSKAGGDAQALAELADLSNRADQLAEAFATGDLDLDAYRRARRKVDERSDDLNERLASSRASAPLASLLGQTGSLAAAWKGMGIDRQRAVLEVVLDRVVVHSAGSEYYSDRLHAALMAEAEEAEAAGDLELARRRRRQAESRKGGGGSFRPERLEPIWLV